jgi:hypothetical protein
MVTLETKQVKKSTDDMTQSPVFRHGEVQLEEPVNKN